MRVRVKYLLLDDTVAFHVAQLIREWILGLYIALRNLAVSGMLISLDEVLNGRNV